MKVIGGNVRVVVGVVGVAVGVVVGVISGVVMGVVGVTGIMIVVAEISVAEPLAQTQFITLDCVSTRARRGVLKVRVMEYSSIMEGFLLCNK